MKIKSFIKNELLGWKIHEIIWIIISCILIISLSVYLNDNIIGIISSLTGIMYTICAGKGKLSAYIFGVVNCTLYAFISYKAGLYGETMLNALYYFPMQFIGFFIWSKNINEETHEVNKFHMKNRERIITVILIIVLTYIYGLILSHFGDSLPFWDSFTTTASVIAIIISIKMYSEQWWIWFAVNSASIYMWWINFTVQKDNIATLIMWALYLINGIILGIKWELEIKSNSHY